MINTASSQALGAPLMCSGILMGGSLYLPLACSSLVTVCFASIIRRRTIGFIQLGAPGYIVVLFLTC